MSRRKSQQSKRARHGPAPFSRAARRRCSTCGNPALRWLALGDAWDQLGPEVVNGLLDQLDLSGAAASGASGPAVDFWHCDRCHNSGALGPLTTF